MNKHTRALIITLTVILVSTVVATLLVSYIGEAAYVIQAVAIGGALIYQMFV